MRSILLSLSAFALVATALPAAAQAQNWRGDPYRQQAYAQNDDRGTYQARGYQRQPSQPYRPQYRGQRRPRCDRGSGGTIIGAIAGGLLGNSVAGRGDRGVGTIIGAGAGALAGRAIDRDC